MTERTIPNSPNLYVVNVWEGSAEDQGDGWANEFQFAVVRPMDGSVALLAEDYGGATHRTLGPIQDGVHFLVRANARSLATMKRRAKSEGFLVATRRAWPGTYGDGYGYPVTVKGAARKRAVRKRPTKRDRPRKAVRARSRR